MLLSTNKLAEFSLLAVDGRIGAVSSIFFDDRDWSVRYVAALTMRWLGREVLIVPQAFGTPLWDEAAIPTSLTKAQVKDSPPIELDRPVSRQQEQALHAYYGLGHGLGAADLAGMAPAMGAEAGDETQGDPHLRSTSATVGLRLEATDGEIGHVEDFIVDLGSWSIRYLIVDTRNWLPGRKVFILPDQVDAIDWSENRVRVDLTREQVKDSPEFDPDAPINREFETRLLDFYGRPQYWFAQPVRS